MGLRLLLLASQNSEELCAYASQVAAGDTDIMTFLNEQVLASQSPALLQFLLDTAVVERFSLPLYRALSTHGTVHEGAADDNAEDLLAQLLRENLFVVSLGEGWYRYHAIFRELLLHELKRVKGLTGVAEQHRRASAWLEQNGTIGEAIRHAIHADDDALAIAIFQRHRIVALNQQAWQQLEQWLAIFPKALVEQNPILTVTQAWVSGARILGEALRSATKRLGRQLENNAHGLDETIHRTLLGEFYALSSGIAFVDVNFEIMAEQAQKSLELLPLEHSHGRVFAYMYLCAGYRYTGQPEEAEEVVQNALEEERHHNSNFGERLAIPRFAIDFIDLELKRANETALQLRQRAEDRGYTESQCWANYYLGRVAYVENRLEDAKKYFELVIERWHSARFTPSADSYLNLALVYQAQGAPQTAVQVSEEAARALPRPGRRSKSAAHCITPGTSCADAGAHGERACLAGDDRVDHTLRAQRGFAFSRLYRGAHTPCRSIGTQPGASCRNAANHDGSGASGALRLPFRATHRL